MTWWWLWSVSSLCHWVLWITPANRERRKHACQLWNRKFASSGCMLRDTRYEVYTCEKNRGEKRLSAQMSMHKLESCWHVVTACLGLFLVHVQVFSCNAAVMLSLCLLDCFWYLSMCSRVTLLACCHCIC